MLVLGLTGSAAMGKSTVAAMFADAGVPVFDADAAVHALYRGAAVPAVGAAFPETVVDGAVDRDRLREKVIDDDRAMARLESIIHPLVAAEEGRFRSAMAAAGYRAIVIDIPLLFETSSEDRADAVIVVSAPAALQRERMLARPGMTEARMAAMLARQLPDAEKRRRAHFVIDTRGAFAETRHQVAGVLHAVAPLVAAALASSDALHHDSKPNHA